MSLKSKFVVLLSVFVTASNASAAEQLLFLNPNQSMPANAERLIGQAVTKANSETEEEFMKLGGFYLGDSVTNDGLNTITFTVINSKASSPSIATRSYLSRDGKPEFDILVSAGPQANFDTDFVNTLKEELKKQKR